MGEEPRSVRVLLFDDEEHAFPNAEYHVDYRTRWLTIYRLVEEKREEIARFDLETVRSYEYVVADETCQ